MSDQAIEQEIQAKGLTAPRITPADLEANISSEHYFTAGDGFAGAASLCIEEGQEISPPLALDLLTFCVLVLSNGFTVTGESACASPENFDAELVRKIARQNAINKVWPLMGYELKCRLHQLEIAGPGMAPHQQRVMLELKELEDRHVKLDGFIGTGIFMSLSDDEQQRLHHQRDLMRQLIGVLSSRVKAF